MLEIDECRPCKHDGLEEEQADVAAGVVLDDAAQKLPQIQHGHEVVYPLDVASQQFIPQFTLRDRERTLLPEEFKILPSYPGRQWLEITWLIIHDGYQRVKLRIDEFLDGRNQI